MDRPSTSKHRKVANLERGRTRVLSQDEYNKLQFSEKKKHKSFRIKEEVKVPNFAEVDPNRFTSKSNKKVTAVEQLTLNMQSKLAEYGDQEPPSDRENMDTPTPEEGDHDDKCKLFSNILWDVDSLKVPKERNSLKKSKKKKKKKVKTLEKQLKYFQKKAVKEDTRERCHFKNGAEGILLRVYDVVRANRVLEYLGIGFYHTSIQIYGHEYYYGGHDEDITGIVETDIGESTSLHLKETLLVGYTFYDADDVDLILDEFGKFWQGNGYDPFSHNCNDFSKHIIQHLCHEEGMYEFPTYVNRFSKLSSLLRVWFQPLKNLFGDVVNAPEGDVMGASQEEGDLENGQAELTQDQIDNLIEQAKIHAEKANSFYITCSYDKAEEELERVLEIIEPLSNETPYVKDIRISSMSSLSMV